MFKVHCSHCLEIETIGKKIIYTTTDFGNKLIQKIV